MRITCFIYIISIAASSFLHAAPARAQVLEHRFSGSYRNMTLRAIVLDLQDQTETDFGFTGDLQLDKITVKEVRFENETLRAILVELFKGHSISFEEKAGAIILSRFRQQRTISGRVTDENGGALPGATIIIKGSTSGVSTETDGTYSIEAETGQTLEFSYVGYKKTERTVGSEPAINVRLEPDVSMLNDIVVVGYGEQKRSDVTTAIGSVRSEDINNFPSAGVDKALVGKIAGVQIMQTNGAPGAGVTFSIRGKSTITAGTDPLFVVDGIPLTNYDGGVGMDTNPLDVINVNDIASVDVLKDASAAAIYGSRGSNGVVIITTKRGKRDKPVVSYNALYGTQQVNKKIPMLDAYEYAELIYDAHNNSYLDLLDDRNIAGSIDDDNATRLAKLGGNPENLNQVYLQPAEIFPYLNKEPGLTNTDWQDAIFRNAPFQSHSLSVTGGSPNLKYYFSGNYLDQQGVVIQTGYKRYNGRINLDAIYEKFKIGTSINYSFRDYQFQPTEGRYLSAENIVPIALAASPFFPIYNEDGSYNYGQYNFAYATTKVINPVALANLNTDLTRESKLLGNVFAAYNFTPALSNKLSFGINIANGNREAFRPSTLPTTNPASPTSIPRGTHRNSSFVNWIVENTLSFNKRFNEHSIQATASFSAQKETQSSNTINATGYPNDLVKTLNAATDITSFSGSTQEWSLLSALARVQYNFKEKYLLSAAIRADGSSRFGPDSRYGYFPSASVGWMVDKEDFMQNQRLVSSLKVRASYGLTGNFQIGNYAYQSLLSESNYVFGPSGATSLYPGLYQSTAGNNELGWEKTSAFNIGLDVGILGERLQATVDAYINNTSDLLLDVPVPQSSGFSTNITNIGKVRNKGLEISLAGNNQIGKLHISNSANISFNRNKVLDLGGANSIITKAWGVIDYITEVGKPIGNYYTLVHDGVFQSEEELSDPSVPKVQGAKVGDFKFVDQNGDGLIDGTNDRAVTGNYMPDFTYGFSSQFRYKILDLNVALQGVHGNEIANINSRYINSLESFTNNTTDALDRFRSEEEPGNGWVARANRSQRGLNAVMSSYSIKDGSYLRIRDITLGVRLPERLISKAGISTARIYFTANNPFTFTKYNAYNPEISQTSNPLTPGIDYGSYPLTKSYLLGINLSF